MKLLVFIFLLFANCQSTQKPNLESPPNFQKTIESIEEDHRLPFPVKQELVAALKESQEYANNCYASFTNLEKELKERNKYIGNLQTAITEMQISHEKEISDLEKELSNWRKIKFWFWTTIISFAVGFLIKLLWPLIRKGLGIPI